MKNLIKTNTDLSFHLICIAITGLLLSACQTDSVIQTSGPVSETNLTQADFEADRKAILAMAGNYDVSFDFLETVSFVQGYKPKDRYVSGAHEVVRVIEDRGDFISLQHILVVGGPNQKFPIKHWRQDWQYEPEHVLVFIGGNAWEMREVPTSKRVGAWSQTVYQVDDSPRYGAVAEWSHANGVSEWVPPAEWRPLPRRDMTKRDDYHVVLAVNRHAITPDGWVHEQDNSKLVLSGNTPQTLVREIGVNTYTRFNNFQTDIAETYWSSTDNYWKSVRDTWTQMETSESAFALTLQGEPSDLYMPLLEFADAYNNDELTLEDATAKANETISAYTTTNIPDLKNRLRKPRTTEAALN